MNELINLENDDEQAAEDIKLKGLTQVSKDFLIEMAMRNKSKWGGIWKAIKGIDKDQNGFVTSDELEVIFKEYFPLDLDRKSTAHVFKEYASPLNKVLINYKSLKDEINAIIIEKTNRETHIKDFSKKSTLLSKSVLHKLNEQNRAKEE